MGKPAPAASRLTKSEKLIAHRHANALRVAHIHRARTLHREFIDGTHSLQSLLDKWGVAVTQEILRCGADLLQREGAIYRSLLPATDRPRAAQMIAQLIDRA